MLTALSSKAIMTKAKAMYSRHLTPEQYREMINRRSVPEIAAYLKEETAYQELLSAVQPTSVHRGQLESMLRNARYNQYARLIHYDSATAGSYYRQLMGETEIEQILEMVRLINAGHPELYVTRYPAFLEHSASFSFAALAKAHSFPDVLQVLARTPYAEELRACQSSNTGERIDYTACEAALLTGYYERLEKIIDRYFRGRVRQQLHELLQTRVELYNIRCIYRVKKFFPDTNPERLRGMLLPSWKRVRGSELDALLSAQTAGQFLSLLNQSRYAKYFGEDDFLFIEYKADCISYHLARRYLHFASDAPTAFTAFMILSELELDNITTIIEGVRYGVSAEEITSMLVL